MKELKLLPQFKLIRSESNRFTGVFDSALKIGNGWYCYLVNNKGRFVDGNIYDFEPQTNEAIFKLNELMDANLLEINQSYAYLDGYMGERVAIVLDETRNWKRESFQPIDAVEYTTEKGRVIGKVGQSPTFSIKGEGKIVKDAWDHEHCNICNETISLNSQPFGFVDQNRKWLCEKCYTHYVQPKSFGFLTEAVIKRIRGL